jgi:hypothetical protein
MNPTLKYIVAVIAGIVLGSAVNMGIVTLSPSLIPPPDGIDMTTMEGLKEGLVLMQPKHFIMPFLAHAIGTLIGAFTAFKIASFHNMRAALTIGVFFLIGGVTNIIMLPGSPIWFTILDVALAYLPMAWLGGKLADK